MNNDFVQHYGVKGMHWGVKLGPPYPLDQNKKAINDLLSDLSSIRYKNFTQLMDPKDVEKQRKGSCHDQVYYEATKLQKAGISPQIKFLIEADKDGKGGTTHSFVSFRLDGTYFWLENAWGGMEGLRQYKTQKDMMNDVKRHWGHKNEFPFLYSGDLDFSKLKPGMSLQDIIDATDFDEGDQ